MDDRDDTAVWPRGCRDFAARAVAHATFLNIGPCHGAASPTPTGRQGLRDEAHRRQRPCFASPKNRSVGRSDDPKANPAARGAEVRLYSGDVTESDLDRRQKPPKPPPRCNADSVGPQFESREWPRQVRSTRNRPSTGAVAHPPNESHGLSTHVAESRSPQSRGTFPNTGASE